jgi:ketosteroid isomerase-like protein
MKKLLVSFIVVSILAGWACTQKLETPEETKARIQQESAEVRKVIEANNADLSRWYAIGDIDSVVTVFAEDARQMPPNGAALEGQEAIREFWKQAVTWGQWNFDLNTVSVIANGPIAVELGRYLIKFTPGPEALSGMTSYQDTGNYVCYWRLEEFGKWRIVYDIANRDKPLQ